MDEIVSTRKSDEEYAATMRALIRHENEVSNHRTTWLMVTQGILATAASALLENFPWHALVTAVVAILVTLSIGHSLNNSFDSRQYFKKLWKKRVEQRGYDMEDVLPLDGGYPNNNARAWLLPDKFIPKVITVAWLLLIFNVLSAAFNEVLADTPKLLAIDQYCATVEQRIIQLAEGQASRNADLARATHCKHSRNR